MRAERKMMGSSDEYVTRKGLFVVPLGEMQLHI